MMECSQFGGVRDRLKGTPCLKTVSVMNLGSWNKLSMEEGIQVGYCGYPD